MTKTYSIAFDGDLLIATVPTGGDLDAAIDLERKNSRTPELKATSVIECVRLTDEPSAGEEIVYSGTEMGWLMDETGKTYNYAVR